MEQPVTPFDTVQRSREDTGSLASHYQLCVAALGPAFRMRCLAEDVHAFVAPRFVTTVCAACLVLISAAMAF